MNSESGSTAAQANEPAAGGASVTALSEGAIANRPARRPPRLLMGLIGAVAVIALIVGVLLWQRLVTIQEQLARQSADSGAQAIEARALATQARDMARDASARQAVMESKLSEVALQRSQLEELMQSLSRSRDENLVVDIESALRLAQQQAMLTGSAEPLLAALRTADQRLARVALPRLSRVRAAIGRDIDRVRLASVTDVPGLLVKIDELAREMDELPLTNAMRKGGASGTRQPAQAVPPAWWERALAAVRDDARDLLRVSRIDQPEAMLLAPEQAFFLRENLKLKLLNARLALLARQIDAARADMTAADAAVHRYFDPASRRAQVVFGLMQQVRVQLRSVELPGIDETLSALSTAAAGR